MPSQNEINKRIINEIDNLDADQPTKSFLKAILCNELDNIDRERWSVIDAYKEAMENCFGAGENEG